jgi:tetratricopeptide (TPR) repeat protein
MMRTNEKIIKLIQEKKYIEAEKIINSLKGEIIKNKELLFLQGIIKANQKKFIEAKNLFEKFLQNSNEHFNGNLNLAGCYHEIGDLEKAITYYNKCTNLDPNNAEPFTRLAMCYRFKRHYEKAIINLNLSLKIQNTKEKVLLLGNIYKENGNFEKAQIHFEDIIKSYPDDFEGKLALANLEIDKGNLNKADILLQNLLSIPSITPEIVLRIKIDLGKILMAKGEYSRAINEYLSIGISNSNISYNLALCHLFLQKYELGWNYHEERIKLNTFGRLRSRYFSFTKPIWDPNRPKKNLLIWGEQGIGDVILQSQFIEMLKNDFLNLTLAVEEKLLSFFKKIYPDIEIINIDKIDQYHNYDFHLPTGSLGKHFQKIFDVSKLNNKSKYNFNDERVPQKKNKLRCGLSWQSTNKLFGHKKSIKLNQLSEILKNDEIEFINLQFSYDKNEVENMEKKLEKEIFSNHEIDCHGDIEGVAALIKSCDLVITISNSNAHIAGKLGINTFLLLPFSDGKLWYWGTNDDKQIPWYPAITPIRCKNQNDWDHSISTLNEELQKLL